MASKCSSQTTGAEGAASKQSMQSSPNLIRGQQCWQPREGKPLIFLQCANKSSPGVRPDPLQLLATLCQYSCYVDRTNVSTLCLHCPWQLQLLYLSSVTCMDCSFSPVSCILPVGKKPLYMFGYIDLQHALQYDLTGTVPEDPPLRQAYDLHKSRKL